jgi:16S rRNA G1207 methylase RsmC
VALWAAREAAQVVALRPSIDLVTQLDQRRPPDAGRTLEVRLADRPEPAEHGTFDVAILLAPFFLGNEPVRAAILGCAAGLKPDGALYAQLHRRHGGETFLRFLGMFFETVDLLGMGPGQRRLYRASRPRPAPTDPATGVAAEGTLHELTVGGVTIRLRLAAGVFGARGIDPGSRLLIETVRPQPGASILDVGCGAGVIGLALAARDPQARVVLSDSSRAAVELARSNVAANELRNAEVRLGDAYDAVAGERFGSIIANLPAHRGHVVDLSTAGRFITGAAAHLRRGGAAWFVANRALPYERTASRAFRQVQRARDDGRYKVLLCTQPR